MAAAVAALRPIDDRPQRFPIAWPPAAGAAARGVRRAGDHRPQADRVRGGGLRAFARKPSDGGASEIGNFGGRFRAVFGRGARVAVPDWKAVRWLRTIGPRISQSVLGRRAE
jgi:hypothetical protein